MASRRITDRLADIDNCILLRAIAMTGSMSQVAVNLGITQQAISARIGAMERKLGIPLLERGARGSYLTEAGRLVVELAEPLIAASDRLESNLQAMKDAGKSTTQLRIAASQTIAELFMPEWLTKFRAAHPRIHVNLKAGNSQAVESYLEENQIDCGLVEGPVVHAKNSITIGADELITVVAPHHPWVGKEVSLDELAATPLLLREEGSGTRACIEELFSAHGLRMAAPAAVMEATAIIKASVIAGIAPAIMSTRQVVHELQTGQLVQVSTPAITREFHFIYNSKLSSAAEDFLGIILDQC
ncbi:MAG: LysR family transcriptional regulator [Corynebacterium sp.]|nr:LysR family transcriptional regulator [Corynebacterium sp.]